MKVNISLKNGESKAYMCISMNSIIYVKKCITLYVQTQISYKFEDPFVGPGILEMRFRVGPSFEKDPDELRGGW